MPVLLHIDTALNQAQTGFSRNGVLLDAAYSDVRDGHAEWLHITIQRLMSSLQLEWKNIDAVSVNHGPGSYTGLRVGMAAAKGFCFAANLPLITVSCTELIALAAMDLPADLYCAMIDARRMEVFTAVYDGSLTEIVSPSAMILDENSYSNLLNSQTIVFCGNGAAKFKDICNSKNATFTQLQYHLNHHIQLSIKQYNNRLFKNLAYTVPEYGKAFYTIPQSKNG